ncbi:MAG: cupin domain-containing protein [Thermoleophilaceae bacterium]
MPNVFDPDWDAERDQPPFRWRRARLGRQAGARELGASLFELSPGAATFPLHAHYANEEMIVVLAGRPSLTGADGEMRVLAPGDVIACPAGRDGAHRLDNHGDEPVRVLIVSTMRAPEVNEMLEDNSFWVRDYAPGLTPEDPSLDVPGLRPSG